MPQNQNRDNWNAIIKHVNPEYRPEDQNERKALVDKACDNLHVNENSRKLLVFMADHEDGAERDFNKVDEITTNHTDNMRQLTHLGFVEYLQRNYVRIDWRHIMIFAKYINATNAASLWRNAEVEQVKPKRDKPIRLHIADALPGYERDEDMYRAIEDMSEEELQIFLEHFRYL